jgi:GTP-binding protein HflX
VLENFDDAVAISALKGLGMENLMEAVNQKLFESFEVIEVKLPYDKGGLLTLFHDQGKVDRVEHERDGVVIHGRLPGRLLARFQPYLYQKKYVEQV